VNVGHPIVIRRVEPDDAEAMQRLHASPAVMRQTLQAPYASVEIWRKRLVGATDDYVLVATVDGELVGAAGLHSTGGSPRRRHAAMLGIAVRDDRQRRGVGKALMSATIDLAERWLNLQRLELTVYTDNLAAQALYRRFGFAIEGTAKAYAFRDGEYVNAYLMARVHRSMAGVDEDRAS